MKVYLKYDAVDGVRCDTDSAVFNDLLDVLMD
jgi:hypothetical protein